MVALDFMTTRDNASRDRQTLDRSFGLQAALADLAPNEPPYEIALNALADAVGAELGALGVVPVGEKRMSLVVTHGYPSVLVEDLRVEPGTGILGQVLATGQPLVSDDAARDFPQCARRHRYRSGSFVVVPMKTGGEVIGAVALADRRDGTPFSQGDLEGLQALLPSVTLAVARSRMYDRVRELQHLATVDSLTGLYNRRHFRETLDLEVHRARRQQQHLAAMLLDADGFKAVNDTFGHQAGDALLKDIADALRHTVRVFDTCARVGGDEFAVLMPGTDASAATLTGERIRRTLNALSLPKGPDGTSPKLCVSIGVAVLQSSGSGEDVLADADRALYQAKKQGGDRVQVWQGTS